MRGGDPLAGVLILKVQVKVLREEQGEQIEAQNQDNPSDQNRVGSECVKFAVIDAISCLQEQMREETSRLITEDMVHMWGGT